MESSEKNRKRKVAFIGCWVKDLAEQCLAAAGSEWECVTLDEERFKDVKNPFARKALRATEYLRAIWRMRKIDVLVIVFVDSRSKNWIRIARALGKKCVLYWLGTDVKNLTDGTWPPKGLDEADMHLANSEGLMDELSAFAIDSKLLVTPNWLPTRLAEMPEYHEVLLSIPDNRREFYGYSDLMRLADDFPDVPFHVVRTERPEYYQKSNIIFEGMLDREQMDNLFNRISIVVRWPIHDGTSLILMESALKGKYIITRNPFPVGVMKNSYEGLVEALREILSKPVEPRLDYHEFALAHFTQEVAGKRLGSFLDTLL